MSINFTYILTLAPCDIATWTVRSELTIYSRQSSSAMLTVLGNVDTHTGMAIAAGKWGPSYSVMLPVSNNGTYTQSNNNYVTQFLFQNLTQRCDVWADKSWLF